MEVTRDLLPCILSFLDVSSLFRCMAVSKDWMRVITNGEFRRIWQSREHHEAWVLVHKLNKRLELNGICRWLISTGNVSKFTMPGLCLERDGGRVVASSRGLVCIRWGYEEDFTGERFAVGNPLTREWKELPSRSLDRNRNDPDRNEDFRLSYLMEAMPGTDSFRVGIVDQLNHNMKLCCSVYDSSTNSWCYNELPYYYHEFNHRNLAWYDLVENKWIVMDSHLELDARETDGFEQPEDATVDHEHELLLAIESGEIEMEDNEYHYQDPNALELHLPHPVLYPMCLWRADTDIYVGGAFYHARSENAFGGFGAWRLCNSKPETVQAVWKRKYVTEAMEDMFYWDQVSGRCSAQGNLLCVGGHVTSTGGSVQWPQVVCDLNTGSWYSFSDVCPMKRNIVYTDATLYTPSLRSP